MIDYSIRSHNLSGIIRNGLRNRSVHKCAETQSELFNSTTLKNNAVTFEANPSQLSSCTQATMCVGILTALAIGADYLFFKGKHANKLLSKLKGNKTKLFKAEGEAKVAKNAKETAVSDIEKQVTKLAKANNEQAKTTSNISAKAKNISKKAEKSPIEPKTKTNTLAQEAKIKASAEAEKLQKQLDAELKTFEDSIPNLSRTELARERYNLQSWGCELDKLKDLSKERDLTKVENIRFKFLENKLNLVTRREKQIEQELKAFHPEDTVSRFSDVSEHHDLNGYNYKVRNAVDARANNMKGLTKDEIQEVLETEKWMAKTDKEFKQLQPLSHDCVCYKGFSEFPVENSSNNIPFKLMQNAKVGDVIVLDTGYTYTAFDRKLAEVYGGEGLRNTYSPQKLMMLDIHFPKGAKVSRNMENGGEAVAPRGARYEVLSKKIYDNGDIDGVIRYILPDA